MDNYFELNGSYLATPVRREPNDDPDIGSPSFDVRLTLARKLYSDYQLTADAPRAVSFGGLNTAAVVIIRCDQKIQVKLTTPDGAAQIVPVDDLLIHICQTAPASAIDLVRLAGVTTNVKVFLGEKA